jgi:glycosyltransferase involved in cell wall biosynthesis
LSSTRQKTVAIVQTQAENAGAQEIARQLAQGFEKRGWRTRQIFFYRRTASFDNDPNVFFCARRRPSIPLGVIKMLGALFAEFRKEKPDAVVMLQHYGNVIAAPVARAAGKSVLIANQLTPSQLIPGHVALVDKIMGMLGFYDHIVVNSAQTEADYGGYPAPYARRLTRIDHGFFDKSAPMSKSEARARLSLPEGVPLLGCAARLHQTKQVDLAIRILAENRDQHLALAGQGQERDALEALAVSLGVRDRVHFLGELGADGMGAFLAALDCFVFPSAMETFGLAPVEAAQAGVPVVANDIEVLREVLAVKGEPCALFVDAGDTATFAAAVNRVLSDPALHATLTRVGRRLAERYPLDAMVEDYLRLMERPTA